MFLVKRDYFNKIYIIKGFITALFFSAFIYLSHFNIEYKILNTILALLSLYFILKQERPSLFFTGFFVAVLWFYWIGNSLEYYGLSYLFVPMVLGIGLIYAFLFLLTAIIDNIYFRACAFFLLSFCEPFGFNWFKIELIFIDSFLPSEKLYFALVLLLITLFIKLNTKLRFLLFLPLFFIVDTKDALANKADLKISMPQLNVKQEQKWLKSNLPNLINENLLLIDKAILEKKDLVVLPETVFPILLNNKNFLMANLIEKSKKIDIVLGALYLEDKSYYNASYHFSKGKFTIAKKLVLVPFGEEIPLPKYFVDLINDTFYNGASDYKKAKKASDFNIKGIKFRNAICYEATSEKIYENLNGVKYMIAISNNAWFTPSIEPTLQKLLIKYYARKYDITVYHSINGSDNYIIHP